MKRNCIIKDRGILLMIAIYMSVNMIFLYKYISRTSYNPWVFIAIWSLTAILGFCVFPYLREKQARSFFWPLFAAVLAGIGLILWKTDPLQVNVDRWSATTYFLDGLFRGEYPYGIHTHVSETNFPSPFPLWHYINIPFWLMGDVGIGLLFFLTLFTFTIRWFTQSWNIAFITLFLLALSPAYWWEVVVRSDGLSNGILVFAVILWMERRQVTFRRRWLLTTVVCACMASTRLSAIIPMAIYIFRDYFKAPFKNQLMAPVIAVFIILLFFSPYILWDTTEWVFFSRNPFISQTSTGSPIVMLIMIVIAITLALKYNTSFPRYVFSTAAFIFFFFFVSILIIQMTDGNNNSWTENPDFDISYLTLSFPYCLYSLSHSLKTNNRI